MEKNPMLEPEYIDRKKLLGKQKTIDGEPYVRLWDVLMAPVEDVAPVAHGRWQDYHFVKTDCPRDGFPTVKCSNCGIVFCDLINNHHFMYHYCPNCGANMRDGD